MRFLKYLVNIDWVLLLSAITLSGAGLLTMSSFGEGNYFFSRQLIWLSIAVILFIISSFIDWRFLRKTSVVVSAFSLIIVLLSLLFLLGAVFKGTQGWFSLGIFAVQPAELAKLVIILVLAKYFTRRHIEIAHIRHIVVSGLYAFVIFALIALQPDFGSAVIIFAIWLGMVLVSGISKKHLLTVSLLGLATVAGLWFFAFEDYQKARIINFFNPLADIRGTGYNAYQSTIAVGSGQIFGKGIGFGSQSKLKFLPEYQTDFIFAAFAEEWGLVGVSLIFILFAIVIFRLLLYSSSFHSNFEALFTLGVVVFLLAHFIIHVGMNIGLLPVTGLTMPFMSYGGSHLLIEFFALGIVVGMNRYSRRTIEPKEMTI